MTRTDTKLRASSGFNPPSAPSRDLPENNEDPTRDTETDDEHRHHEHCNLHDHEPHHFDHGPKAAVCLHEVVEGLGVPQDGNGDGDQGL